MSLETFIHDERLLFKLPSKWATGKRPRLLLFFISFICTGLLVLYIEFGIDPRIAFGFALLWLLLGYICWLLLFTIEGHYIFDKFISGLLIRASYPERSRLVLIFGVCFVTLILGIIVVIFFPGITRLPLNLLAFIIGSALGIIILKVYIPYFSIDRTHFDSAVLMKVLHWTIPFLFIPLVFNNFSRSLWGFFAIGFGVFFLISQLYILIRLYTINYHTLKIGLPDDEEIEYETSKKNRIPLYEAGYVREENSTEMEEFMGLKTKDFRNLCSKVILDLYHRERIENPAGFPVEDLRDKLMLWYSERNYNKIVDLGKKYINAFIESGDFSNISFSVTSLYVRSLIRTGRNDEAKKELFRQYGKSRTEVLLNIERADWYWNIGETESAIRKVRNLIERIPICSSAKNCLMFYLVDRAIDHLFMSKITNGDSRESHLEEAKNELNEAAKLLDEVKSLNDAYNKNSYYWSNVGYYYMALGQLNDAMVCYARSINAHENVRSRIGIGLIYLVEYKFFDEARFHFIRAISDVFSNKSSRYYKMANGLLELLTFLLKYKMSPNKDTIYCMNAIFQHADELSKDRWNRNKVFSIIPEPFFQEIPKSL